MKMAAYEVKRQGFAVRCRCSGDYNISIYNSGLFPLERAGMRINKDASKNTRGVEIHITQDEMVWDLKGCELVSWVVAMSLGFIIRVRVRLHALSRLNRFMEEKA